jgi:hypothetical protein
VSLGGRLLHLDPDDRPSQAEAAKDILNRYETIPSADEHPPGLHLLPDAPSRTLDIGSGTGRDAAWLAAMGHRVVAAEPTDELRVPGMALHPSPRIEWLKDSFARSGHPARPGRDVRPRHAHGGLDASRCAATSAGMTNLASLVTVTTEDDAPGLRADFHP